MFCPHAIRSLLYSIFVNFKLQCFVFLFRFRYLDFVAYVGRRFHVFSVFENGAREHYTLRPLASISWLARNFAMDLQTFR